MAELDFKLISADSHVNPRTEMWSEYWPGVSGSGASGRENRRSGL